MCYPTSGPAGDDLYFVMSNATDLGGTGVKRYPKSEERMVLCDLGYSVDDEYGPTGSNYHETYSESCNSIGIYGVNDGVFEGDFNIFATVGLQEQITAALIQANDHVLSGYSKPEIVSGSGILNNNPPAGFGYTPNQPGVHLIRYVPVYQPASGPGIYGNLTYVYVFAGDPACADECGFVGNSSFNNPDESCGSILGANSIPCWFKYSSTPDIYDATCAQFGFTASTNDTSDEDVLPTSETDTGYVGFRSGQITGIGVEEGLQTILTANLVAGQQYDVTFQSRVSSGTQGIEPGTSYLAIYGRSAVSSGNFNVMGTGDAALIPLIANANSIPITNTSDWEWYNGTFTAPVNIPVIVIGAEIVNVFIGNRYLYIDNFSILGVANNTPPEAYCSSSFNVVLDENGATNITEEDIDDGSIDGCGPITLSIDDSTFECTDIGENVVTLTVTDINGNSSTCQTTVTVVDNTWPVASCQDISVFLDANGLATISADDVDNGSFDNCADLTMSIDVWEFSCADLGPNTVTLTLIDAQQNTDECMATVTVVDEIDPTPLCQNISVELGIDGTATIEPEDIDNGSTDNCGIVSWQLNQTQFTCANLGANTVTLTMTDASSNAANCQATVTVVEFDNMLTLAGYTVTQANAAAFVSLVNEENVLFTGDLVFTDDVAVTVGLNTPDISTHFKMGSGTFVIVDPGAWPTFQRTSFSAGCAGFWRGMVVHSEGVDQNGTSGVLELQGCEVRHADVAIYTGCDDCASLPFAPNYSQMWKAGNIIVKNTLFVDNNKSVAITMANNFGDPYSGQAFSGCQFLLTNDFYNHFAVWNANSFMAGYRYVQGYGFDNCSFRNEITGPPAGYSGYGWANRGPAVSTFRRDFALTGVPGTALTSGFNFGLRSMSNFAGGPGMRVQGCQFEKNKVAIAMEGLFAADVVLNDIEVGMSTGIAGLDVLPSGYFEGIVLNGTSGFDVMFNTLTGQQPLVGGQPTLGIRVVNSMTADDVIYKNTLTNLRFSNRAQGQNTDGSGGAGTGLRYLCNNHEVEDINNMRDFINWGLAPGGSPGVIAQLQFEPGVFPEPDKAAGNWFTETSFAGLANDGHFRNGGPLVNYHSYQAATYQEMDPSRIAGQMLITNASNNVCISEWQGLIIEGGENGSDFLQSAMQNEPDLYDEWQAAKFLYLALLDEGDTEQLKEDIDLAWSNDTWVMRQRMLDASPYLSREVLKSVADRTLLFPHPIALEIFAANPEILRDPSFITYLETKLDPMPEYMVDILLESSNNTTLRSVLMENLDTKRTRHARLTTRIVDAIANDSTSTFADRRPWLERMKSLNAEYELAEREMETGQTAAAQDRISTIHARLRLSEHGRADAQQFGEWLNLRVDMIQNDLVWGDSLGEGRMDVLYGLLQYPKYRAGLLAANVLVTYYDLDWFLPAWHDENWEPRRARAKGNDSNADLNISPNPAGTYVNIAWENTQSTNAKQHLLIYDAGGSLVKRMDIAGVDRMMTLNVTDWISGLYFCELQIEGQSSPLKGKFIIVR